MFAIYKNELSSYFRSLIGYIVIAFVLFFAGVFTAILNFLERITAFPYVYVNMSFVFLIAVPLVTMRTIAEERHQKTDQLLYSLPVSTTEVVMGKYLALLTVFLIPTLVTGIYPLILSLYGNVQLLPCYVATLGFFLMGAALLSVGLFISSITENQILAAGITFLLLLLNYFSTTIASYVSVNGKVTLAVSIVLMVLLGAMIFMMTRNLFASVFVSGLGIAGLILFYSIKSKAFNSMIPKVLREMDLFTRFHNFITGTLSLVDVVFYVSVCVFFVFLSVQSMEKRRWS